MKCKICNQNETDSTSGICWECANYPQVVNNDYYSIVRVAEMFVKFFLDDSDSSAFSRVLLKMRDKVSHNI